MTRSSVLLNDLRPKLGAQLTHAFFNFVDISTTFGIGIVCLQFCQQYKQKGC